RPGGARVGAHLRRAIGLRRLYERSRLPEPRRRDLDTGVVAVGALDQLVEHRVGERPPPFAARLGFGGRGEGPPAVAFLEALRRRGKGGGIDGRQRGCATGEEQDSERQRDEFHSISFSFPPAMAVEPAKASPWGISPCSLSGRLPVRRRRST